MSPFLPSVCSVRALTLPESRCSGAHFHESEVCFHFMPGNLRGRRNFWHPGTGTQSGISDGNNGLFS